MKVFAFGVLAVACVQPTLGCDLCAVYSAAESRGELGAGVYAGVAEQFTHYGTLQEDGEEVPNPADQSLDSSITQVLLGYNFTERFGAQFNLPVIHRWYQRLEHAESERGTETGIGDAALLAHLQIWRHESGDSTFAWNILGGIKFPTGDPDRLGEEAHEEEGEPEESGVHGHDLTLGSGSWDGIVGTSLYVRHRRFFFSAAVQYAIRTEGDFDYQFANDLLWSGGPGWIAVLNDNFTLSLQANCTGETKGKDEFRGEKVEDTGITSVFLGPEILLTWRSNLSAELGADFPVSIDNTALQIVPDWRLRAAVTWHF